MSTRANGACSCSSITCCPPLAKIRAAVLACRALVHARRASAQRVQAAPGHLWKSISSSANSRIWVNVLPRYGGFFEYDRKQERLEEVARELEDPAVWSNPARAQELGRERARLTSDVGEIDRATKGIGEATELLELAEAEGDESAARDIERDAQRLEAEGGA